MHNLRAALEKQDYQVHPYAFIWLPLNTYSLNADKRIASEAEIEDHPTVVEAMIANDLTVIW